jgi:hypothetical protein
VPTSWSSAAKPARFSAAKPTKAPSRSCAKWRPYCPRAIEFEDSPAFLSDQLPLSSAQRSKSCLRPPSANPTPIRFVIRSENSPQSRFLVQHHEEMSREEKHAGINQDRQRPVKERRAEKSEDRADVHWVSHETVRPRESRAGEADRTAQASRVLQMQT